MVLRFWKYEGCGNDFIIVDCREQLQGLTAAQVLRFCHRHMGVGGDGVLSLWRDEAADGCMKIQNADGTDAGMCGNGLRCMARYLYDEGLVSSECLSVQLSVSGRTYSCVRIDEGHFQIAMGSPQLSHPHLPPEAQGGETLDIEVDGQTLTGVCQYFGNPHMTIFSDADPMAMAKRYGALLSTHNRFSDGVNVGFARARSDGYDAVVFERGVGVTQACGSAACAIAAAAVRGGMRQLGESILVRLPGGVLSLSVEEDGGVLMEGPANRVFDGYMQL